LTSTGRTRTAQGVVIDFDRLIDATKFYQPCTRFIQNCLEEIQNLPLNIASTSLVLV